VTRLLIIDAANVVGARADGWWKDRAGAAARLHDDLLHADLPHEEVTLVLEGQAKQGVRAGGAASLRVVHASKDGDSEIVRQAESGHARGCRVEVVTADRALGANLARYATTLGPTWLLDRL
jgi:hypothetical protein